MNVFYDHLVRVYEIHVDLDELGLAPSEKNELVAMVDSAMHHEVFDLIMTELPGNHQVFFLETFATDPSDQAILEFLREKIPGIEDKIEDRAKDVKLRFVADIRSVK